MVIMMKNYFLLSFRNLIKYKKYSFINILSLSIGLASFILIMLWVYNELSYDSFHENVKNKYVILREEAGKISAATAKPLAEVLKSDYPEVIETASYAPLPDSYRPFIQYGNEGFETNVALTVPRFFDVFNFRFKEGDPETAFKNPKSVILTERMKQKYFGSRNAMGESIEFTFIGQKFSLKVTGILENLPNNTYIQREIFLPIEIVNAFDVDWDIWNNRSSQNFIVLQDGIDQEKFGEKILECEKKYTDYNNLSDVNYSILPIDKIHLYTSNVEFLSSTGDIKYVYIFSVFALIILLIACMNYMNLTNAFSLKRIKEIGIKKVVGAGKSDLLTQYFCESFVITFIALALALVLVELLLPAMNRLAGKVLAIDYTASHFILAFLLILIVTSIISGLYPALFILKFKPVQILKGKFQNKKDGVNLQKGLIIFQFALSIIAIICAVVVFNQLRFIQNQNLGYNHENIICLGVKGNISDRYDAFKNKLTSNTNIISVSRSEPLDVEAMGKTVIDWPGRNRTFFSWLIHVDPDFASTYKLEMKEGRFYSEEFESDKTDAYVINETAQKELGFNPILGKEITVWGRKGKIIGITKDFNFSSLHNKIEPLVLRIPEPEKESSTYRELSIRVKPYSINQSLSFLNDTWKNFFPSEPFNFYFFDDNLNAKYNSERRMGEIFGYFSSLAIFIACLGLYGLTAFMIERKIKDIGVHKILGASIGRIVFIISKRYLWWISISNLIAWPVTYYFMNNWLQNFAYRTNMSWWVFVSVGLIAFLVALIAVGFQAVKAAIANPVDALKYE